MVSEAWLTKSSLLFDRVCYEHHHHEHHHITLSSYRFGKKIIRIITIRNHQDHRKHPNSIRGKKNKIECLFVLIKKKKYVRSRNKRILCAIQSDPWTMKKFETGNYIETNHRTTKRLEMIKKKRIFRGRFNVDHCFYCDEIES